jgi:GxxExxY protein
LNIEKGIDPLTEKVIACAFKVHNSLGPGFNEKIYHSALNIALTEEKINFDTEKIFNVYFNSKQVGTLRLDLVVEDKVIVEIKALEGNVPKLFEYQVLSYLRASGLKVGLLINFGNQSCYVRRLML